MSQINLLEFQRRFYTDQMCYDYLIKSRWSDGLYCIFCGGKRIDCLNKRRVFECRDCSKQFSVTSQTIFHKTRTPLRVWFWAIYILATSKKGVPALYLQKVLNIPQYRTAWLIAQKIRLAMYRFEISDFSLSGIVQVDEIFIGGKQSKDDYFEKGNNKTPFLIAVQENQNGKPERVKFKQLNLYDDQGIIQTICDLIQPNSIIKGDGANAYAQLPKLGYKLISIPLRKKKLAYENLNWVNLLTSNLKRFLLSTHHSIPSKHRELYVHEFAYRFNRRFLNNSAFDHLLLTCINTKPTTLPELNA